MRRLAKLLATTLVLLLAGRAAAAPGGGKTGFCLPPNFNPTANAADRTYKKHLKLLNTMVELFVEGPRSGLDFTALKKRVNHFKESARLQRTGREIDPDEE